MEGFVVSTTSTLEGYEIGRYLGIVSAHVVAGTDVFTDIIASFSDFFGGRSQVYRRELSAIGEEAIEELKEQCYRLGANGLLGVRIDHDEISGKGKSMFMVTASGTAVVANPIRGAGSNSQAHASADVDRDALSVLLRREKLLRAITTREGDLSDESWSFLIRYRVFEAVPHILQDLRDSHSYELGDHALEKKLECYVEYFSAIPEEPARAALHEAIAEEAGSLCADDLLKIIDGAGLADYSRVHAMLQSLARDEQLLGVRLLGCSKRIYRSTDVALMEECCKLIERLFPSSPEEVSSPSWLPGRTKMMWICECGKRVDPDAPYPYCSSCGRGRRGVRQSEAPIDLILEKASLQVQVLKKAFAPPT